MYNDDDVTKQYHHWAYTNQSNQHPINRVWVSVEGEGVRGPICSPLDTLEVNMTTMENFVREIERLVKNLGLIWLVTLQGWTAIEVVASVSKKYQPQHMMMIIPAETIGPEGRSRRSNRERESLCMFTNARSQFSLWKAYDLDHDHDYHDIIFGAGKWTLLELRQRYEWAWWARPFFSFVFLGGKKLFASLPLSPSLLSFTFTFFIEILLQEKIKFFPLAPPSGSP